MHGLVKGFEDGGLTIVLEANVEGRGVLTSRVSWATLKLAEENYQNAVDAFANRVEAWSSNFQVGQVNQARRLRGGFYLHMMAGPPTWWFPRVYVKRCEFCVGWLRRAVAVSRRSGYC